MYTRIAISRAAIIAVVVIAAALTSTREDWEPLSLFVALAALAVVADTVPVPARRVRLSGGLMVQVVAMALLGPAPAVAIGVGSNIVESRVNRVRLGDALGNIMMFAVLGLCGGLVFEVLGAQLGVDHHDTAYALLVMPVYWLLAGLNLAMVALHQPGLTASERRRIFRDTGLPSMPLELLSGVIASAAVLVWAHAGLVAAAALLGLIVITLPLARAIGDALTSGDDLLALRHVSDERAAEVARLASDRERLTSELFRAEERERARLAESLHDGPMQRLAALRQDTAGRDGESWSAVAGHLEQAIAETRAIISSFHPATVRELGFEASVRAAMAPFPASASIELAVASSVDDRYLAGTLLLPVAQELVVNAVKHAAPSTIDVSVRAHDAGIVMEVSDDGVGIDTSGGGRAVQAGHLGLAMVRRRVEDAGGVLDIETRADGGTRSRVTLPENPPL